MRRLPFSFILLFCLTVFITPVSAQSTPPGDVVPLADPVPIPGGNGTIFADVTSYAQIGETRIGQDRLIGQAWGDYDQDGWYDLYVTDPAGPNILYRNKGDGTFAISSLAGQVALINTQSSGAVFADYNNDGYPDLYILRRNLRVDDKGARPC
jgi:hypothetical protein